MPLVQTQEIRHYAIKESRFLKEIHPDTLYPVPGLPKFQTYMNTNTFICEFLSLF